RVTRTGRLGPVATAVTVTPGRIGPNVVRVRLRQAGRAFTGAKELKAQATLPARGVVLPVTLRRVGPGLYISRGLQLLPDGRWRLSVALRVSAFDEYTGDFTVPVAP
ncbi:MAG: hypothetical protein JWM31_820, partial [Solirubrobacterales bacterium]|nr:hypothetical protein [Solirubrobacterales bacterium]